MAAGKRIDHAEVPIVASPSGLPIRHLVTAADGASALFVGEQWLAPGERVLPHTHPVEEVLIFLSGSGEATLDHRQVSIGAGVSLLVPAGVVHGFRCTGPDTLRLILTFPVPQFAETTLVDETRTIAPTVDDHVAQ